MLELNKFVTDEFRTRNGLPVTKLVVNIENLRAKCSSYAATKNKTVSVILGMSGIPTNIFANAKRQYVYKKYHDKLPNNSKDVKQLVDGQDYGVLTEDELIDICKSFEIKGPERFCRPVYPPVSEPEVTKENSALQDTDIYKAVYAATYAAIMQAHKDLEKTNEQK